MDWPATAMELDQKLDRLRDEIMTRENVWSLGGFLAVVLAAAIGRTLLKSGWRASTGTEPPQNPDSEEATWTQALGWAVVTGALVGVVRTLSRKGTNSIRRWSS